MPTHLPLRDRVIPAVLLILAAAASGACAPTEPDLDAIAEVEVAPDSTAATIGAVVPYTATVRNGRGEAMAEAVTWSSTNTGVATVNGSGAVTIVSAGSSEIRASAGGKTGTAKITGVAPATLNSLTITPPTATLFTGATQQFTAAGTWSDGGSAVPPVTWTATGGTVSNSGLYTAGGTPGSFRVIGTHTGGTRADTSTITINAVTLTSLTLTPPTASLNSGATQQFAVAAQWSDGSSTTPAITWSATGGTVSNAGLYTAGGVAGSFRVIAAHTGGTLADTSTITITVPVGGLANECASPEAGWIWCDDFDQNRLSSYFEYEDGGGLFTRVNGVGNDGSYGMRAHFNVGTVSAGALHLAVGLTPQTYFDPVDAGTEKYRELYWRVYLRLQPGWSGGGGDKLSRAFVYASTTSWAQAAIAHVWAGDDNTQYENILMVDPARGTDALGNLVTTGYNDFAHLTWLGLVRGTNPIYATANAGVWRCIEAHARLNDAGQSNGVLEFWIDGTLDAQKTGMNFIGSFSAYGLNAVFLENYWNNGSPAAQDRFFDNFVVSTQRIGC